MSEKRGMYWAREQVSHRRTRKERTIVPRPSLLARDYLRDLHRNWPACEQCGEPASYYMGHYAICKRHAEELTLSVRLDPVAVPRQYLDEISLDQARFEVLEDRRYAQGDNDDR